MEAMPGEGEIQANRSHNRSTETPNDNSRVFVAGKASAVGY